MKHWKDYYFKQTEELRGWLSERCGTSTDYLEQLAYGTRKPGKQFKLLLESVCGEKFRFGTCEPQAGETGLCDSLHGTQQQQDSD